MARLAAPVAVVLGLAACAAHAPAIGAGPSAISLAVANVTAPAGTTLVQACTPTGPELCFNAIDDNCNGVIDEGCGEPTGLLQFTAAWGDSAADVNLTVVTPTGERIPNGRARSLPSGFTAGRDCPGEDRCDGQNVENVAFDGLEPPRGHYAVEVALVDLHGAEAPVKVHVGVRIGGRVYGFEADLAPGDEAKRLFSFDLP
jgi:tRNA (guanosine-2'-O-)-methyltransferase